MQIPYKVDPHFNPTNLQSSKSLNEVHYYISDDKTHDNVFVQRVFTLHWGYLKSKGCFPKHRVVWSDCSTQFKCVHAWYFTTQCPRLTICEGKKKA